MFSCQVKHFRQHINISQHAIQQIQPSRHCKQRFSWGTGFVNDVVTVTGGGVALLLSLADMSFLFDIWPLLGILALLFDASLDEEATLMSLDVGSLVLVILFAGVFFTQSKI
jgi:hypothetical protein